MASETQVNFTLPLSVVFSLIIGIEVKPKAHFIKSGELREEAEVTD